MKRLLLPSLLGIVLFSSCATAYKAGQTPDDVYYSPGREAVTARNDEERFDRQDYEEYISSQDDRYLRMKVANRSRWSSLDDYAYWYDSRYDFSSYNNYAYYNPWNSNFYMGIGYYGRPYWGGGGYYGWNSPYYTLVYYGTPKYGGGAATFTSGSNLSAYKNKTYNNTNFGYRDKSGNFIPANNNNSFGSLLKRVFTTSPNNTNNSFDRPARTFTPTNNNTTPATSSSAGGNSGGFKSTGSSTSTGRGGRG